MLVLTFTFIEIIVNVFVLYLKLIFNIRKPLVQAYELNTTRVNEETTLLAAS